jgi:hypothetical protein
MKGRRELTGFGLGVELGRGCSSSCDADDSEDECDEADEVAHLRTLVEL